METVKINVFRKKRRTAEGREFVVNSSKLGKNNTYYEIRFNEGCNNINLIPTGTQPYVLVVRPDKMSVSTKNVVNPETGETFEKRVLYVRYIDSVEEYIEEPVNIDDL